MNIRTKRSGKRRIVCEDKHFCVGYSVNYDLPQITAECCTEAFSLKRIEEKLLFIVAMIEEESERALTKIGEEYRRRDGVVRRGTFLRYVLPYVGALDAQKCKFAKKKTSDCGGCIEYGLSFRSYSDGDLDKRSYIRFRFRAADGYLCAKKDGKKAGLFQK